MRRIPVSPCRVASILVLLVAALAATGAKYVARTQPRNAPLPAVRGEVPAASRNGGRLTPRASAVEQPAGRFAVRFKGTTSPYRVQGVFVLPGERLDLEAVGGVEGTYALRATNGNVERRAANRWTWQAPSEPGLYPAYVVDPVVQDSTLLNLFVMFPSTRLQNGRLNGYPIGDYPPGSPGSDAQYEPPAGFVEVTAHTQNALVSPHFRLGQFVCKAASKGPRYVVLQEKLVMQLEDIVEGLNASGHVTPTLHVMSGYRTPSYNRALGNVSLSMHQFGGAADVFVDRDGDATMDDLNRDGRVDRSDAALLFDLIERRAPGARYKGGLATYAANAAHGPFVHVDVRGRAARWDS